MLGPESEPLRPPWLLCGISPILLTVNCSRKDKGQTRFSVSHRQGPAWLGGSRTSHSSSSQPLGGMGSDCSNLGSLVLAPA